MARAKQKIICTKLTGQATVDDGKLSFFLLKKINEFRVPLAAIGRIFDVIVY